MTCFSGTPENFEVYRFKLAMWKVGGIKIETAADRQKIFASENGKWTFFCFLGCGIVYFWGKYMIHTKLVWVNA